MTAESKAPDPDHLDCLISENEAAWFLNYSVRALQNWRVRGGGPEYVRVSRRSVRYRRRDLVRWADERLEAHTSARPAVTLPEEDGAAVEGGPELTAAIEQQRSALTQAGEPPQRPKPAEPRIKRPYERLFVGRKS